MSAVVIVGGGPAGMATAISLAQTDPLLRIVVIERSDYDELRIGETLPPTIEPLLRQLGVWEPFIAAGHQPAYSSLSAWGSSELMSNEFIEHPHNRGWHLDRRSFDRMLAEHASARGIRVLTGTKVVSLDYASTDGWVIHCANGQGASFDITAEFVVDASGRHSYAAIAQGAKRIFYDRLIALVGFLPLEEQSDAAWSTMIETCEYGWWYSSTLPTNQRIVACMTDNDVAARMKLRYANQWMEHLAKIPHTSSRLGECVDSATMMGPSLFPANSSKLDHCVGNRWLAVGDAASTFDPVSSQGVFKAIRSGILGSYAMCDFFCGNEKGLERYQTIVEKAFESYLQTRAEFYAEEQRWPQSPFWSRRQEKITLEPFTPLTFGAERKTDVLDRLPMNLVPSDVKQLCSLCNTPTPAHEVIASFFAGTKSTVSDRHVIVALQQLIAQGIITTN